MFLQIVRKTSTRLYRVTSQKTAVFVISVVRTQTSRVYGGPETEIQFQQISIPRLLQMFVYEIEISTFTFVWN
jgi:hypothetical protein